MSNILDLLSMRMENIEVPESYQRIWNDINLPIQTQKISNWNVPTDERDEILSKLSKRAYFLTTIADYYGAKNILEVGTSRGWQFFSFAEYCKNNNGHVWSCDIIDHCNKDYLKEYSDVSTYILGDSKKLANVLNEKNIKIDLFYIDGSHDRDAVLKDISNLKSVQSEDSLPVWIFDDFDERFGCYHDIYKVLRSSPSYFVYSHGQTASGNPNHQAMIRGFIK